MDFIQCGIVPEREARKSLAYTRAVKNSALKQEKP